MGGLFEPVRPGTPMQLKAATMNAIMDAVRQYLTSSGGRLGGEGFGFGDLPVTRVRIANTTAVDVPRLGVLGWDEPLFLPGASLPEFVFKTQLKGIAPTAVHSLRCALALEPIRAGKVGYAAIAGVLPAMVNVTNALHAEAEPPVWTSGGDSKWMVSASRGSARILWKEGGTGARWAVLALNPHSRVRGELFTVLVTQTGGVAGSSDPAVDCSFVYTAKDLAGVVLGTGLSPVKRRDQRTQYEAPPADTPGVGYLDSSGAFKLWDANERIVTLMCPPTS